MLISSYGVGAMVPIENESLMVAGLEDWPPSKIDINEPRLAKKLGVKGFIRPRASDKDGARDIPVIRFPEMQSCRSGLCEDRLDNIAFMAAPSSNTCLGCNSPLVPSRFVIVCRRGHIDDFPFSRWVHGGVERSSGDGHVLQIKTMGKTASLADIVIRCSCGMSRSMDGSFNPGALEGITDCTGRMPWLGEYEDCTAMPRTIQRGASNVYFPMTASALSIPPWSEGAFKAISLYWQGIMAVSPDSRRAFIENMEIHINTPYTVDQLLDVVNQRIDGAELSGELLEEEYAALMQGFPEDDPEQEFVCVEAGGAYEVRDLVSKVMAVPKLKEVKALTGFTRLMPSNSDEDKNIAKLSKSRKHWLPAIETLGEGVFFDLSGEALTRWETRPEIMQRAERIHEKYRDAMAEFNQVPERKISPRFILIHTLSHALLQQWSLDCGYPAASLKERLFVSDPGDSADMAGLLICTATSDSAGSLGGVVALAEEGKLRTSLLGALNRASWCSADPLCSEADATGADSLNMAACHACVLLPEPSCDMRNRFLDRVMLIGTSEDPSLGFFSAFVERD
jgi:hypothetical protein